MNVIRADNSMRQPQLRQKQPRRSAKPASPSSGLYEVGKSRQSTRSHAYHDLAKNERGALSDISTDSDEADDLEKQKSSLLTKKHAKAADGTDLTALAAAMAPTSDGFQESQADLIEDAKEQAQTEQFVLLSRVFTTQLISSLVAASIPLLSSSTGSASSSCTSTTLSRAASVSLRPSETSTSARSWATPPGTTLTTGWSRRRPACRRRRAAPSCPRRQSRRTSSPPLRTPSHQARRPPASTTSTASSTLCSQRTSAQR